MKAFTLIELIIYLALLSVLMLGSVSLAYGVAGSSSRDEALIRTVESGNFALQKLAWAVSAADQIEISGGTDLTIRSVDETLDPISIRYDRNAQALEMKEASGSYAPIAKDVTEVLFEKDGSVLSVRAVIEGREFMATHSLPYE